MMTTTDDDTMRVWVGCLACYNAGRLVGEWVDATEAADSVADPDWCLAVHGPAIAADEPVSDHEEWWCFDVDGVPTGGECSPDEAQRLAESIAACAEGTGAPLAAVRAYLDNFHGDVYALDNFEEAWCGEWDSEQDYAENLAEDCGYLSTPAEHASHWAGQAVPNPLLSYIDWEAWTRDLFMGDYWSARCPGGGVYVFRSV